LNLIAEKVLSGIRNLVLFHLDLKRAPSIAFSECSTLRFKISEYFYEQYGRGKVGRFKRFKNTEF